jgi:signal recognition particle receptor subunit beta
MVQFNFSERTIKAKVVYYGPAQSGKTTNLEQIHLISDPAGTNRLISLNTAHDRTLFFDLLPFSLGAVAGYDFKVQLYTVPGQVQYNATRRVVLAGADAVVFVADSGRNILAENLSAFDNMKVNLLANRLAPEKVPLVIQYNKRDLPDACSEEELNRSLNPWGRRTFTAVASEGRGVMETFVAVIQEMLASIASKYNLKEKGLDPATVGDVVTEAFAPIMKRVSAAPPAAHPAQDGPARVVVSQMTETLTAPAGPAVSAADSGLISEELLHRSIRSNVELAEALAGLVRDMNLGLGTIQSHAELLLLYREDAKDKRAAAISSIQQEAARLRRIVQGLGRAGASAAETPLPHHASSAATPASVPSPPAPPVVAPAPAPAQPAPARASVVPAAAPVRAPASGPDTAPDAPLPPSPADLAALLRDVMQGLGHTFDSLAIGVDVRVAPGILLPASCSGPEARRALARLVEGVVTRINPASDLSLRCERKTVLLRTREGEVRRDFLMLGLAQAGTLPAEEQQRVVHGSDAGALGQAVRLVRGLGGFVRFAPLPSGGLETRVFLPAA